MKHKLLLFFAEPTHNRIGLMTVVAAAYAVGRGASLWAIGILLVGEIASIIVGRKAINSADQSERLTVFALRVKLAQVDSEALVVGDSEGSETEFKAVTVYRAGKRGRQVVTLYDHEEPRCLSVFETKL